MTDHRSLVHQLGELDVATTIAGVIAAAPDGMAVIDARGEVIVANRPAAALFGLEEEALAGKVLGELLGGIALEAPSGPEAAAATAQRPDRGGLEVELRIVPVAGTAGLRAVSIRDAGEGKRAERRLRDLSDHDPLTGLVNRQRFEIDAEKEIARSARYGGGALLVLGLDNFKQLNEAIGFQGGDGLIREVAAIITERIRETDIAARLGGDRFALVLTEVAVDRARAIGEDIAQLVGERRLGPDGRPLAAQVSGGVVGLGTGPTDVAEAIRWAELAMQRASAMGGDRVVAFEDSLLPERESALSWGQRIRAALDNDSFVPHFQPILELASGSVTSWEVLIRMQGPGGEVIPPDSFVPTAERFGLIQELDRWVVRNAIAAMCAHEERDGMSLEINLSAKSIGNPDMLAAIKAEIDASGVDPRRLIFEVTETAAIGNLEQAARFGREIIDLGCGFALDDFGTGFASFYYLKRLPLTHLKIDGDFIRGLAGSAVDQLVVKAIVEIAGGMGLKTIAEYVEDAETMELLRDFGVDYCQGFEIGRPEAPRPPDLVPPPHRGAAGGTAGGA